MIIYKDILEKLKQKGYNSTRLREEKLLSQATLTNIRKNKSITTETLDKICKMTGVAIEELIEYRE